jgi:hypothetical protein
MGEEWKSGRMEESSKELLEGGRVQLMGENEVSGSRRYLRQFRCGGGMNGSRRKG